MVAAVAKHRVSSLPLWLGIESAYMLARWLAVGFLFGRLFERIAPKERSPMAYDEAVADRVRAALQRRRGISERKMFGGIAFVLNGHMVCGVLDSDLVLRLGEAGAAVALKADGVRPMDFTGRPMKSMVYVASCAIADEDALHEWLHLALAFARTLPPK